MEFSKIGYILFLVASVLFCFSSGQYQDRISIQRNKRDYHGHGVTGPVHTFVKTDKHANYKWGVRHHVGQHYAGKK